MDIERRAQLLQKRAAAQADRRERQRNYEFYRVTDTLAERGVEYRRLETEELRGIVGDLLDGPTLGDRLWWDGISNSVCRSWRLDADRDALTGAALVACTPPEAEVVVLWEPWGAGIAICMTDCLRHADVVLDAQTTWIVSAIPDRWLIEIDLIGGDTPEVCYTLAMPPLAERSAP